MNWVDYREKLGIGFNDREKLVMCKNRLNNYIEVYERYFSPSLFRVYANTVGESIEENGYYKFHPFYAAVTSICMSSSVSEFVAKFVALINACGDPELDLENRLGKLVEDLLLSILDAFQIQYELIRDRDGVFVFPKGVPEFDRELVSEPLLWLSEYPETERAWSNVLRKYSQGVEPSEVADGFRKALERFFQNFFESKQSLENLKKEYGRYLKEHGIPGEIASNLETLLQQYINFMNNYAKHHDQTSNNVLEYIMYQTGNIIRLLILQKSKSNQTITA